ncbi:MAG: mannosylglycerate synthase domain-containing protein [Actinomycetota bacterium]
MSLVIFPFKEEDLGVVAANLSTAAGHDRVHEVWAVAAAEGSTMADVRGEAIDIAAATGKPVSVFAQERLGSFRSGKGDGMNTALRRAAERGFERIHFYDADILNFDEGWIDGAEQAADRGYQVVRHRFPRAATDAMITWMVTRPGLAIQFPGTLLPRLGQPLGGELLITGDVVESLVAEPFVLARSDWGIDTVLTHTTAVLAESVFEHNIADGKRHALYGALTDIRDMILECLDAVASLRDRPRPGSNLVSDPPAEVPVDLKETVGYDLDSTRAAIADPPGGKEAAILGSLGIDPERPIAMDGAHWQEVFPKMLDRFRLDDPSWRHAVFRLWVERVIHYTTHHVPRGYEAAMDYLEGTISDFEERAGS